MAEWGWVRHYYDAENEEEENGDQVPMQRATALEVPRWIALLAHRNYARRHRQDFETVHRRGGFGSEELIGHLGAELRRIDGELAQARRRESRGESEREKLSGEVQLLRSVVRTLLRLLTARGVRSEDADLLRDAARLVGEELR